jgi:hypothetical protein
MQLTSSFTGARRALARDAEQGRAARPAARAARVLAAAPGAGPPPAWPGRAPVPDAIKPRDGPKASAAQCTVLATPTPPPPPPLTAAGA